MLLRKIKSKLLTLMLGGLLVLGVAPAAVSAESFIDRAEVQEFVRSIADTHQLNQNTVAGWFAKIESQPGIIKAISTPAERVLKWYEYRAIFLGDKRIQQGKEFANRHKDDLLRAEAEFGVPPSIITAIIGVETFYGDHLGKHTALEALATLGFDFPRRSKFFKKELEEFIVLASEEDWDPLSIKGSYAAAMGMPQFISSSYRAYAIDFDGDGKRDLWNSVPDVIGSVANYLSKHGWQQGQPIVERWNHEASIAADVDNLVRKNLKPVIAPETLAKLGFTARAKGHVSVNRLEQKDSVETWIGYRNFYVITRYNHSRLYAMAVYQLSAAISAVE